MEYVLKDLVDVYGASDTLVTTEGDSGVDSIKLTMEVGKCIQMMRDAKNGRNATTNTISTIASNSITSGSFVCSSINIEAVSELTGMTPQRDVAPETKSMLVKEDGKYKAKLYDDGYYQKTVELLPEVDRFKILSDNGVETGVMACFKDGTKEKTMSSSSMSYDRIPYDELYSMISMCLFKRMMRCGSKNTGVANKLLDSVWKQYLDQACADLEKKCQEQEAADAKKRREARRARRKARKEKQAHDAWVSVIADAIRQVQCDGE